MSKIMLFTGGARSGKSTMAETAVRQAALEAEGLSSDSDFRGSTTEVRQAMRSPLKT